MKSLDEIIHKHTFNKDKNVCISIRGFINITYFTPNQKVKAIYIDNKLQFP